MIIRPGRGFFRDFFYLKGEIVMKSVKAGCRPVPSLPAEPENGERIALHGCVYRIREMSGFAFVVLRTARELVQTVYIPEKADFSLGTLREGDTVKAVGEACSEPRSKLGYDIVLRSIKRLSGPEGEPALVINKKELGLPLDVNLQYRSLCLRNHKERCIFRVQEGLARGCREYLTGGGFTEIHTPKIVSAGAEGGSNIFSLDYFGKKAYLAQSPQLYKQAMVGVFERVYEIGPVFRAERHDTSRHLNEYTSVDFEMGFIEGFEDIMAVETAMLTQAMGLLQREYAPELRELGAKVPVMEEIPSLTFMEAKELLKTRLKRDVADYYDFEPAEEQLICDHIQKETGSEFVFVTHYPSAKRPFYAMDDPEDPRYTLSFDLLFRGLEVTTGGQRIHDWGQQVEKMRARGMNIDEFESYLLIHRSGMPPHGGLGLGLERLTMKLIGLDNVRRACLYPRDMLRLEP
jgi:nondiscriminating aspartyl-tRNA synthetase